MIFRRSYSINVVVNSLCTWTSMSVTVNPFSSLLSLTLRRNLPICFTPPSSSFSSLRSPRSSSSSSFTFPVSLGCGQYSSHFWNPAHRHFESESEIKNGKVEGGRINSPRCSPSVWWAWQWCCSSPATPCPRSRPPCAPLAPGWRWRIAELPCSPSSQRGGFSVYTLTEHTSSSETARACMHERARAWGEGLWVKDVLLPPSLPVVVLVVRLSCWHTDSSYLNLSLSVSLRKTHAQADAHAEWELWTLKEAALPFSVRERNNNNFYFEPNVQSKNREMTLNDVRLTAVTFSGAALSKASDTHTRS